MPCNVFGLRGMSFSHFLANEVIIEFGTWHNFRNLSKANQKLLRAIPTCKTDSNVTKFSHHKQLSGKGRGKEFINIPVKKIKFDQTKFKYILCKTY